MSRFSRIIGEMTAEENLEALKEVLAVCTTDQIVEALQELDDDTKAEVTAQLIDLE